MNDIEKGDITFFNGKYRVALGMYSKVFYSITYNSEHKTIYLAKTLPFGESIIFQSNMEKKINE